MTYKAKIGDIVRIKQIKGIFADDERFYDAAEELTNRYPGILDEQTVVIIPDAYNDFVELSNGYCFVFQSDDLILIKAAE